MDRDGTRQGFDIGLTRAVADAVTVPVIASGGVGNLDHLAAGVREGHAAAVLAASIFHFGEFTISDAKRHMAAAGLAMRLATCPSTGPRREVILTRLCINFHFTIWNVALRIAPPLVRRYPIPAS